MKFDKAQLCEKIKQVFPDIGDCDIDIKVAYDNENDAWVVDLKKDRHHLKTFLEPEDADACMDGKQCVGLAIQIAQLRSNIVSA